MPVGRDVEFRWGVRIPMRDGILLSGTLYLPRGHTPPSPCVVTLTPYVADTYHDRGVYFASQGMPFLIVDSRGRGNSAGVFRPFIQEAEDGYDVVEWLACQPCCNGKVAMWGGSYGGYDQWATAKERPPHLTTIVPVAAPYCGLDFPMRNNIFHPFAVQWLTWTGGRTYQNRVFSDSAFWSAQYQRWHESGASFRELDGSAGKPSEVFQQWLDHPMPDAFWDAHNPTAEQCAQIDLPVLTITGIYDDDQPGALEHYRRHVAAASPETRDRHYLVIGPWDHFGTRTPTAEFGGLRFGPESLVDLPRLHREWYAWVMCGGPKPTFLKKRVAIYTVGAEQWRYFDTLEAATAGNERWFLDSSSSASSVFACGVLTRQNGSGAPDHYVYDPRDVSGPEIAAEARVCGGSLTDQSVLLALAGKCLVYQSAPFDSDNEITGFFSLEAWLAIDCPDTDFYVSVHEIDVDGSSVRLSTDAMRARYRENLREERLITTAEPLRYDFRRFTFVSRVVKRGHRLRLVIAPMGRLIESTFAEKNYNAGGVVAEECAASGKPVTARLYHDVAHPSALSIPLGATSRR